MRYTIGIRERGFNAIKAGTKKVEGRVPNSDDDIYQKIIEKDEIEFENETTGEKLIVVVGFVHKYPDIASMLRTEGPEKVLSSFPKTVEHGVESFNSFEGYEENVKKFGIYAIGLRKL